MRIRALTVTEVNTYLKRILNQDPILSHIQVRGEISNFKMHSSGHAYFAIKDQQAKLNCVMFRQSAAGLDFQPADGMSVVAHGRISIYERDGKYQLYVDKLVNEGQGDLYIAFEKLKKQLSREGYFEESIKKTIPFLPQKIGLVTSPTGAAVRDILSVIARRNKAPEVTLYPVRVQGETAAAEIAEGIRFFNTQKPVDVILIARGGGSIEELWAFNERDVADAIFESVIPIISGVGHETDSTISDFVADQRAATPSAAAERAVPDAMDLNAYLEKLHEQIHISLKRKIETYRNRMEQSNPSTLIRSLEDRIHNYQQEIDYLVDHLRKSVDASLLAQEHQLKLLGQSLHHLSPLNQLDMGYGIIMTPDGESITRTDQVKTKDVLDIFLNDGKLKVSVNDCIKGATWHGEKDKKE